MVTGGKKMDYKEKRDRYIPPGTHDTRMETMLTKFVKGQES